jgi:hypothetical protein
MECDVLFTSEFAAWWQELTEEEQDSVDRVVRLLAAHGAALRFPYSSGIESSNYSQIYTRYLEELEQDDES